MQEFIVKYLIEPKQRVLDVGSMDCGGTYRPLFDAAGHIYTGLDLSAGLNVDIVADGLYHYPIADNEYDAVVSGQTVEHVQDMHRWIKEIARVVRPGGLVCIIGPNLWEEHRYPVDCWRILPDGMMFLLGDIGNLDVIVTYSVGRDTIGIARK